jgi:hypothetical protein
MRPGEGQAMFSTSMSGHIARTVEPAVHNPRYEHAEGGAPLLSADADAVSGAVDQTSFIFRTAWRELREQWRNPSQQQPLDVPQPPPNWAADAVRSAVQATHEAVDGIMPRAASGGGGSPSPAEGSGFGPRAAGVTSRLQSMWTALWREEAAHGADSPTPPPADPPANHQQPPPQSRPSSSRAVGADGFAVFVVQMMPQVRSEMEAGQGDAMVSEMEVMRRVAEAWVALPGDEKAVFHAMAAREASTSSGGP